VLTGEPVLGVSAIAIDPTDTTVMYIGTGEVYNYDDTQGGITVRHTRGSYGMGILKTTDGGLTWTRSLDWSYEQQRGIWAVRIDPVDPATVWAATTEGTYRSTDAGGSWQRVNDTVMATDLVIDPNEPGRVFIACGNFGTPGVGIYRTTDGGATWQRMTMPAGVADPWQGKAQLAMCPAAPGVIYASIGNGDPGANWTRLVRSQDGGDTWQLRSSTDYASYQGWFAHDVGVDPTDPEKVLALGIDVWKSTTGGTNLVQKSYWYLWDLGQTPVGGPEGPPDYSHADHHDIVYHPTNPNIVYLANDGGVFRSLNGGETFAGVNGAYQSQQFYAGFTSSAVDPDLALGGLQDNATAIYLGDLAWYRAIGGDGAWTGIDPVQSDRLYGSAQYLQMFRSTDGGENWTDIQPPTYTVGSPGFVAPYGTGHGLLGAQWLYAAGTRVARSFNSGASWSATAGGQELDGNPALALEVAPTDRNVVYVTTAPVATRAGVFRTDNGGESWHTITGQLPDRYPVGLAVDPTDDRTVVVTFSGFGTGHVYRSIDAGATWQDITGDLPDVPTTAAVIDPVHPSHLYVGNDLGVFFSADAGATWEGFSLGLPDAVMAMDLTISPVDRKLRVSTYGNGVYERDLQGEVIAAPETVPDVALVELGPALPNPFNPATEIRFRLARAMTVSLAVHDLRGRRVRTLVAAALPAGPHAAAWNGRDDDGRPVPSGVYVAELRAGGVVRTEKLTLAK